MEKKILLEDLVNSGTNIRKQITPKVRVSDQGAYPIGEIWDANTTLNTIVDGASIAFDSLKEVEEKIVDIDNTIGDLGQIPDTYATYQFDLYDTEGQTMYSRGKAQLTAVETTEYYQIVIIENTPIGDWQDELIGKKFFIAKDSIFDGQTLIPLYKVDKSSAGIALKMTQLSPTTYKNPTIKEYIDYSILKCISEEGFIIDTVPANSVDTQSIIDGSIKIEDLSDEVKNKLLATVDENAESVYIP